MRRIAAAGLNLAKADRYTDCWVNWLCSLTLLFSSGVVAVVIARQLAKKAIYCVILFRQSGLGWRYVSLMVKQFSIHLFLPTNHPHC